MRKSIATMAAAWMLTACASGAGPTPRPTPAVSVTPWTLLDCPPLPQPVDGSHPALLENHTAATELYRECRDKHQELVRAICLLGAAPPELCRE